MKNIKNDDQIKKGYRVHFDRLRASDKNASYIKTHKYKLDLSGVDKDALWSDFEKLGVVTDSYQEGSLMWLIVRLLAVGFVFVDKPDSKPEMLIKMGLGESRVMSLVRKIKNSKLRDSIDNPQKIISFLKERKSRSDHEKEMKNVKDKLKGIFNDSKVIEDVYDLLNNRGLKKGGALEPSDRQIVFDEYFFKKDKEFYNYINNPNVDNRTTDDTFVIQNLSLSELKEIEKISDDELIYWVIFNRLIPLALNTDIAIEDIPTKFVNSSGLSRFLNATFKELKESDENIRNKILESYQGIELKHEYYKSKQSKEKLDYLSGLLSTYFSKVKNPLEVEFLTNNFGSYRHIIAESRFQGWFSNFINRLNEYKTLLLTDENVVKFDNKFYGLRIAEDDVNVWESDNFENLFSGENKYNFTRKSLDKKGSPDQRLENYYVIKKMYGELKIAQTKSNFQTIKKITENCNPEILKSRFLADPQKEIAMFLELHMELSQLTLKSNFTSEFKELLEQYNTIVGNLNESLLEFVESGKRVVTLDEKNEKENVISVVTDSEETLNNDLIWINKKVLKKINADDGKIYLKKDLVLKKLPNYPRFVGESKKSAHYELNQSWSDLVRITLEASKFINTVTKRQTGEINEEAAKRWNDTDIEYGLFRQKLNGLLKIAKNSHPKAKHEIIEYLSTFVDAPDFLNENPENVRFYVSKYQKRNYNKVISLKRVLNYKQFLKSIETELFADLELNFNTENDVNLFFDLNPEIGTSVFSPVRAELLKWYWSLILLSLSNEIENIPTQKFNYIKNSKVGRFLDSSMKRENIQRVVQAGYCSKIKGCISLLSRKEYTLRYVIQIVNGEQSWIRYVPVEFGEGTVIKDHDSEKKRKCLKRISKRKEKSITSVEIAKKLGRRYKVELHNGNYTVSSIKYNSLKPTFPVVASKSGNEYNPNVNIENLDKIHQKHVKGLIANLKKMQGNKHKFSNDIVEILQENGLDFVDLETGELVKKRVRNNDEITRLIWDKLKNNNIDEQEKRKLLSVLNVIPHRWEMILKSKNDLSFSNLIKSGCFIALSGTSSFSGKKFANNITSGYSAYSFPVLTKGHQLQFFEKMLYSSSSKMNGLDIKLKGTSLILEKDVQIKWEKKKAKIIDKKNKNGDTSIRFYWANPWEISKLPNVTSQDIFNADNYLGIDLGEYGIGWAVLPKNGNGKDYLASGFHPFPILKKLRDEVDSWQLKQASGIFIRPSSKLARIREAAIGEIRNYIHSLCLYYNAQPVYEDEVDAFESGGQRIRKLYKSIKTSDVYSVVAADKIVMKNAWGVDRKSVGEQIGAAMTSQVCRKCGRSATATLDSYRFKKDECGKIINPKINVNNKKIEINNEKIHCDCPDGEYDPAYIRKIVKNSQRTSSDGHYGSQDKFVCQFEDCDCECNADEQAAKNIALKLYLKKKFEEKFGKGSKAFANNKNLEYKTESGNLSTKRLFLDKSPEYSISKKK